MATTFLKLSRLVPLVALFSLTVAFPGLRDAQASYYYHGYYDKNRADCITEACDRGVTCAFEDNLKKVIRACRYVDGDCVEFACQAGASCNFESTLFKVIRACRGADPECAVAACQRGGLNCAFESTLFDVLERCGW